MPWFSLTSSVSGFDLTGVAPRNRKLLFCFQELDYLIRILRSCKTEAQDSRFDTSSLTNMQWLKKKQNIIALQ